MNFGIFNHGTNMGAWWFTQGSYNGVIVLNQRIIKLEMHLVHFRLNLLI
jgi:hypothetical protein